MESQNISVFLLDVTNSSEALDWTTVGQELFYWEQFLLRLQEQGVAVQAKWRKGDEIICICAGAYTAYVLAYYISLFWSQTDHKPYFGLSVCPSEEDVRLIDTETWHSPCMKYARQASDLLKKEQGKRQYARMGVKLEQIDESLINLLLQAQHEFLALQTPIQRRITALRYLFAEQKDIAHYLHRAPSTISAHLRSSRATIIHQLHEGIVEQLGKCEPLTNELALQERIVETLLTDMMQKKEKV
ncbi:MAG: hypothetical protein ACRC5C_06745 [Bacilli bacterium]